MKRDEALTARLPDPERLAVDLPVGPQGAFYTGDAGGCFETRPDWNMRLAGLGVLDYNQPPKGQPGLWCQWTPTADYAGLEWNGVEKFYHYEDWLQYAIDTFLIPWATN